MNGTEAQLRSRMEREGCTPDEIEDVIGDLADEDYDRRRDDQMMEALEQEDDHR